MTHPVITLCEARIRFCEKLGYDLCARRVTSEHKNNLPKDWDRDLPRHYRAMMAEAAMMLYLTNKLRAPVKWDIGDLPSLPDIEDFIDVKIPDRWGLRLLMQLDAKLDWAYALCWGDQPHFTLRGWRFGYDIKRLATIQELQRNRPCYVLENIDLWDVQLLADEVQLRQQQRRQ